MIEEITPQIVAFSLFLVTLVTPILTLLLSALLLWRYRRAVARAMAASAAFEASVQAMSTAASPHALPAGVGGPRSAGPRFAGPSASNLYQMAIAGPWHCALRYAIAGLAFAAVFAAAARFVYPIRVDLPGVLMGVWIYAWPIVLAFMLIIPGRRRWWAVVGYVVAVLPLWAWGASVADILDMQFGSVHLPARSSTAPQGIVGLWLFVNGPPTLLILLCLIRRVRAVAPLMLALATTIISGIWLALIALFTRSGADIAIAIVVALHVSVLWAVWTTIVGSLAGFGVLGWLLARRISAAYRQQALSDQSLLLDALWLMFATWYAMWLILGGLGWAATALVGLLTFKLVLVATRRLGAPTGVTRDLTFLRVFSLGRRSDALLDGVAKHWRHIGSVQMITGPDVALSTVQPHQFLDFLSRKLDRHFVRDQASLAHSLAERDHARDPDGRFRINNFFCHTDTWQAALPRLVENGEAVLMDLRSFSATNAGCVHELHYLVGNVPFGRCLLIFDDTTDLAFLKHTLTQAWEELPSSSPNYRQPLDETAMYRFASGTTALRGLLRRLCEASAADLKFLQHPQQTQLGTSNRKAALES
jgi:hypothetical protein